DCFPGVWGDGIGRHLGPMGGGRPAGGGAGGAVGMEGGADHGPGDADGCSGRGSLVVKCPFCGHPEDKVVDSREGKEGHVVRRRRECLSCSRRFTTYERVDEIPFMVVKKDGRREPFDRNKLLSGIVKACEKRPVAMSALEAVVDEVENLLQESPEKELPA